MGRADIIRNHSSGDHDPATSASNASSFSFGKPRNSSQNVKNATSSDSDSNDCDDSSDLSISGLVHIEFIDFDVDDEEVPCDLELPNSCN